jgi:hypothetical protein
MLNAVELARYMRGLVGKEMIACKCSNASDVVAYNNTFNV